MNTTRVIAAYPGSILQPDLKPVQVSPENWPIVKKMVPLNGKLLIISSDPATIGMNFKNLINMRYGKHYPRGIGGMTKINSSIINATYFKVRSAFQFYKTLMGENHIVAQVWNTGLTASKVYQHIGAVPATGNFEATELWSDTAGAGIGRFADTPVDSLAYCNGIDTCIWGGDEARCGGFFVFNPGDLNNMYDYTNAVNNSMRDADNVATLALFGGGDDAYTKLLLHMDDAGLTDVKGNTITLNGDIARSATQSKFGGYAAYLDGAGDYLTVADNADWDFGTGDYTIDFWIYKTAGSTGLFDQYQDGNNFVGSHMSGVGNDEITYFVCSGGAYAFNFSTSGANIQNNKWYHIAYIRSGASVNIAVDGNIRGTVTASFTYPNLAADMRIGYNLPIAPGYFAGYIDEFRISKGIARWTSSFSPPASAYSTSEYSDAYVVSPRPLNGVKAYVDTANTNTAVCTGEYFNGSWTALTNLVDGTLSGGKTLAQTGSITFDSTVADAKPSVINGLMGYFYHFTFSGISAGTKIYMVTLKQPFQAIKDLWDGQDRQILAFYQYRGSPQSYQDFTLNVVENSYDANDTATFAEIDSLATTEFLVSGFYDQLMGLNVGMVGGHVNTTASTVLSVYYSTDGVNWTLVSNLSDGTSQGGISLAKSGAITWDPPSRSAEFQSKVSRATPLYHYKFVFSEALSSDVQLFYIGGIPAPRIFGQYKFSLMAQERILLCADMAGKKNGVLVGAAGSDCIFNGDDCLELEFGNGAELTAGCSLYSQFGSSLYNLILFFTLGEMHILSGVAPDWTQHTVTDGIGCVAPLTLKTMVLPATTAQRMNRTVAIWRGADGIYISDGRAPEPIHGDIEALFDRRYSGCINASMINKETAFADQQNLEYHWQCATGSSTTLNREFVYDLKKEQWFEIDRTTNKRIQCGLSVKDTYGNNYAYGFIDTGYMERLEYGNDFDGEDIVHTIELGDFPLIEGDLITETRIHAAKLIEAAKTATANSAAYSHYVDTVLDKSVSLSPALAGARIAQPAKKLNSLVGTFHSGKLVMTTDNEVCGFEPMALAYLYSPERDVIV